MGHLGLTPQSINKFGSYTVRAREEAEANKLIEDAKLLQEIGCFAIVLEKIPATLAKKVAEMLEIPIIGIGAGGGVDGQVLVMHDMLGLSAFGLDALVLFKRKKMAIFFLFSMLLGAALQITNTYGDLFLGSFASIPEYADSFGVKHSVILLSISQMSETLFILAIPFFLKHFGIKRVMLISMFAWVFRFGLFALGDPGSGLWMLILSMIVYGMAFDFFNVSGSLFTEMEAHPSIRASAQGLFFMMTNGVGAIIGGYASGAVVDAFSVYAEGGGLVSRDWTPVWLIFAGYALVIGLLFGMVFRYKHNPEK